MDYNNPKTAEQDYLNTVTTALDVSVDFLLFFTFITLAIVIFFTTANSKSSKHQTNYILKLVGFWLFIFTFIFLFVMLIKINNGFLNEFFQE